MILRDDGSVWTKCPYGGWRCGDRFLNGTKLTNEARLKHDASTGPFPQVGSLITSLEEIQQLPVGTITESDIPELGGWVKASPDTWLTVKDNAGPFSDALMSTWPRRLLKLPTSPKVGDTITGAAELDALPVGARVEYLSSSGSVGGRYWEKQANGHWCTEGDRNSDPSMNNYLGSRPRRLLSLPRRLLSLPVTNAEYMHDLPEVATAINLAARLASRLRGEPGKWGVVDYHGPKPAKFAKTLKAQLGDCADLHIRIDANRVVGEARLPKKLRARIEAVMANNELSDADTLRAAIRRELDR
jgi:hypothetical protein